MVRRRKIASYQEEEEEDRYNQQQEPNGGNLIRRTWVESKKMWYIARPSIFTRLAVFSLTVITQAFAGHLNDHNLTAISIVTAVIIGITFSFLVYVGNLSGAVDDLALETLFSEQGKVMEAKVVYDRDSGRSRGFEFVTFGSSDEVNNAIESLDGVDLNGRSIRVSMAEARPRCQF